MKGFKFIDTNTVQDVWCPTTKEGTFVAIHPDTGEEFITGNSSPNLAQIPSDGAFRKLFTVPEGWDFVGADLANIEIRVLAHYLAAHGNPRYAEAVLSKDMHWFHAKLAGFWTKDDRDWDESIATEDMVKARKASKAFFFGYLYGQGDTIRAHNLWFDGCLPDYTQDEYDNAKGRVEARLNEDGLFPLKKDTYVEYNELLILKTIYGKRVADEFLKNLGGLPELIEHCQEQSRSKGTVTAIDGRELTSRSPHSALNLLLQGSAGIIAKKWMVNYYHMALDKGLVHGKHYVQQAFIHDEYDCRCLQEYTPILAKCLEEGASKVTQDFNTNIPIKADSMVGKDWQECH